MAANCFYIHSTTMGSSDNCDAYRAIELEGDYYTDVNGYQVPQNIRHRFRSTITSELLADRDKVERDKDELLYANVKQRPPAYQQRQPEQPKTTDPDYATLSNDLRSTVCRGIPVQRRSHTKTVHNEDIFKEYFQDDHQPSVHRRRKDWLGRWTEANIVRDRLYKSILESKKKMTE
ncbi:unnamed protein product [Adineta ricciae]|uniref:Uncharacterized protein n=1 Tax=Adineta ricciae TaxID=249248 RepID=A0A813QV81_ADIRI|nr:unnamed protein product [Adineta ricciae]CAF1163363.1 unnamed protein product [Adineta ricciae]